MELLISKWIRETITEYEAAKANQNLYKMSEMVRLLNGLKIMRDNLLKSGVSQ